MSEPSGDEMVPARDGPGGIDKPTRKILAIVPADYRKLVGWLWAMNCHLLPTPLPLALRFQFWVEKKGLTVGECKAVVMAVSEPAAQARHNFANQFLAELAAEVDVAVKRRQAREKAAADRDEAEAEHGGKPPATQAEIVKMMTSHAWRMQADDKTDADAVAYTPPKIRPEGGP